jgi:hypothetical protein
MTENKIIHQCSKCTKTYKSSKSLKKHEDKCCLEEKIEENEKPSPKENNYDVNMTFLDDNQVKVEVKKQFSEDDEDGDEG